MNDRPLEILSGRMNPGIDPTLHVWGWEIPVYLFLGGVVAGVMILLAVLELRGRSAPGGRLRVMPWVAITLLSLGMGALFLDLSHKINVLRFYTALRVSSPMSWGSWLLLLVYPALVGLGLGSLNTAWRRRLLQWSRRISVGGIFLGLTRLSRAYRRAVLLSSLALGTGLGIYTGILLGTLAARPLWNSALLGPLFLVSGISTGAALLLLARPSQGTAHTLVKVDLLAIGAEVVLILLFLIGGATSPANGEAAISLFLGGAWTPWFFALVIMVGLAMPALLETLELRFGLATTAWSPVLVLIGGFALRAILVGAGQDATVLDPGALALFLP